MVVKNKHLNFTNLELDLIRKIFKDFKNEYNARELARMLNANHVQINKLANLLVEKELLIKKSLSNANYYSFNMENKKFIEYLLSIEKIELKDSLKIVLEDLKKFKEYIDIGLIFGSAIKTEEYNDIDILLIHDKKHSEKINEIKLEILNLEHFKKPIRYIQLEKKDLKENIDDEIFYNIFTQNIIFQGSSEYVEILSEMKQNSQENSK